MSFAICFNLDQSKILLSSNELRSFKMGLYIKNYARQELNPRKGFFSYFGNKDVAEDYTGKLNQKLLQDRKIIRHKNSLRQNNPLPDKQI